MADHSAAGGCADLERATNAKNRLLLHHENVEIFRQQARDRVQVRCAQKPGPAPTRRSAILAAGGTRPKKLAESGGTRTSSTARVDNTSSDAPHTE